MFPKIILSNCNGGKNNEINPTQAGILLDVGRMIVHMATQEGATLEVASGLIDVMIRTLGVRLISNLSSTNKFPVSLVDEPTNRITDEDVHQCKACGKTDTLSPKLRKRRRDCPGEFKYPNYCKRCFEWSQRVQRWDRNKFLANHPRPSVGASSSHSVLHVSGSSTGSSTASPCAQASPQVSSSAVAALVSAASTGPPIASAGPSLGATIISS